MKLNTHDRTPKTTTTKMTKILFLICGALTYSIFLLGAFACVFYGDSLIGGVSLILLPVALTIYALIPIRDMGKAYVEITEDTIHVVDYYVGIKREKEVLLSDIETAEIVLGYSHKVRGYRWGVAGISYIVFKGEKKRYLFKIICTPENKKIFQEYIKGK